MNSFNRRTIESDTDVSFKETVLVSIMLRFSFNCLSCLLIAVFTGNLVFAQTSPLNTLEVISEQIRNGNTEQKRDALFRIRNLQTAEASQIAVSALNDSSEIVRATAAYSIIFLAKEQAARVLLPLLRDKSELVRREAAYALGEVASSDATAELLQILQSDKKIQVREAAAVALGKIGDVLAVDSLTKILQTNSKGDAEFLRRAAARSIGQIAQIIQTDKIKVRTPADFSSEKAINVEQPNFLFLTEKFPIFDIAINVLIKTLANAGEVRDVKREAAFALGAIGDEKAIQILQANLNNEDYYLAQISAEALRKIQFLQDLRDKEK